MGEVSLLLRRWSEGDAGARGQSLQATALVHAARRNVDHRAPFEQALTVPCQPDLDMQGAAHGGS